MIFFITTICTLADDSTAFTQKFQTWFSNTSQLFNFYGSSTQFTDDDNSTITITKKQTFFKNYYEEVVQKQKQFALWYSGAQSTCSRMPQNLTAQQLFNNQVVDIECVQYQQPVTQNCTTNDSQLLSNFKNLEFHNFQPTINDSNIQVRQLNRYSSARVYDTNQAITMQYPYSKYIPSYNISCLKNRFSPEDDMYLLFSDEVMDQDLNLTFQVFDSGEQKAATKRGNYSCPGFQDLLSQRCGLRKAVTIFQNGSISSYFRNAFPSFENDIDLIGFVSNVNTTAQPKIEQLIAGVSQVLVQRQQQMFDYNNQSSANKSVFKPMRLWVFASCFKGQTTYDVRKVLPKLAQIESLSEATNTKLAFVNNTDCGVPTVFGIRNYFYSFDYLSTPLPQITSIVSRNTTISREYSDAYGQNVIDICSTFNGVIICNAVSSDIFKLSNTDNILYSYSFHAIIDLWSLTAVGSSVNSSDQQIQLFWNTDDNFTRTEFYGLIQNDSRVTTQNYVYQAVTIDSYLVYSSFRRHQRPLWFDQIHFSGFCINDTNISNQECVNHTTVYFDDNVLSPLVSKIITGLHLTNDSQNALKNFFLQEFTTYDQVYPTLQKLNIEMNDAFASLARLLSEEARIALANVNSTIKSDFSYVGYYDIAGLLAVYPNNYLLNSTLQSLKQMAKSVIGIIGDEMLANNVTCAYNTHETVHSEACVVVWVPVCVGKIGYIMLRATDAAKMITGFDLTWLSDLAARGVKLTLQVKNGNQISQQSANDARFTRKAMFQLGFLPCRPVEADLLPQPYTDLTLKAENATTDNFVLKVTKNFLTMAFVANTTTDNVLCSQTGTIMKSQMNPRTGISWDKFASVEVPFHYQELILSIIIMIVMSGFAWLLCRLAK